MDDARAASSRGAYKTGKRSFECTLAYIVHRDRWPPMMQLLIRSSASIPLYESHTVLAFTQ
jgi:hypothetical protein